jgi:hypothetical protein
MVAYRYDPEHIAPANAAPRCQHIRLNGQRCGAPARRRRRYCHFHEHAVVCRQKDFKVSFIEDATSLQFVLMEVMRLLDGPHPDYRACGLKLYALQIACANMKALRAEQAEVALANAQAQPAQPAAAQSESADAKPVANQNDGAGTKPEEDESLAELLLGLLPKSKTGAVAAPAGAGPSATPAKFPPGNWAPDAEAERSRELRAGT